MDAVEVFSELHKGGAVALCYADGGVRPMLHPEGAPVPAAGGEYQAVVAGHLDDGEPIGVYPLRRDNGEWVVHWLAVDLDEGDDSFVHACNLQAMLSKLGVVSFIEASRSKGYHLWVYLTGPVSATVGRRAMIGACRLVDVPTREVYPKQTELHGKGFGNCLRLPFPGGRSEGRQCVVSAEHVELPFAQYLSEAWGQRTHRTLIRQMLPLYDSTQPKNKVELRRAERSDEEFGWLARDVWNQTSWEDRSKAMMVFTGSLIRQGYGDAAILDLLYRLDERMGKFLNRPDRDKRLREMLEVTLRKLA